MYRHILVPTDGSSVSARAERAAVQIAKRFHSKITAVYVIAPYSPTALAESGGLGPVPLTREEYAKAADERAELLLRRVFAQAKRAAVDVVKLTLTDDDTGAALARVARDANCDLIVMGSSSRRGIERIFVGSVASDVLSGSDVPTLICHEKMRAVIRAAPALALCLAAFASQAAPQCRFDPPPPVAPITVPAGTRIGLALSSGSMHGYAHVGVLEELEARGLPVEVVAGTSVGALVGSLWASGVTAGEIAAIARRDDLDFATLSGSWRGLYSSEPIRPILSAAFRGRPIESWPRRFVAVATNVATGERRLIASGDGVDAVRASSAMPVMFLPVAVHGELLVDGALSEPLPVAAAHDLGANFVIAVDVAYRPGEGEASGLTTYAFQALHILVNSLSASEARDADVVIRMNLHKRWTDCGREGLIAAGREALDRAWPEIVRASLARRPQTAAR